MWIPCTVHKTTKLIKKLKSQQLSATVHMNSSRCPLIECAAAGKKKIKKVKKRKRKRKSWIQTQPKSICKHRFQLSNQIIHAGHILGKSPHPHVNSGSYLTSQQRPLENSFYKKFLKRKQQPTNNFMKNHD